ncbi:MAG TPA: DUF6798 domain-containing protein [Bryobacteraceae bacterium]|nr:DUF6798 domain-containing protein [Bryobacteraceae bacterium]
MKSGLLLSVAVLALTCLNFFQFPGHTYLQQDTQIYLPILEHMWDPSVLADDLLVQKPHVSFTIYDETVIALRKLTGLPFRILLEGQQFLFRALGIWGLYLMASAAGLSMAASLLVAAIVSLGATISGPSVLTFEYEPTPRGFALPVIFLAVGLAAHGRYLAAGLAASVAFLLHAPTTYPFWVVYGVLALLPSHRRRDLLYGVAALVFALAVLWIASRAQAGGAQVQTFLSTLDAPQEALQRMRAPYIWISIWAPVWLLHYLFLYAVTLLGVARLRRQLSPDLRFFALGLPLTGILSIPLSYLMLEHLKLAVASQFQPLRALLFVTLMVTLLAGVAACVAIREQRYLESIVWLILAYLIPTNTRVLEFPPQHRILVVLALSGLALAALWADQRKFRSAWPAVAAAAVTAFFVIPVYGKVRNYPSLHNPALDELSAWARSSTPKSAVFLFPDAGRDLHPGIFRSEALRSVYIDWKSGGQVNYFKDFGEQWWSRWQDLMARPPAERDWTELAEKGIGFLVLKPGHKLAGRQPVFENDKFVVYALDRR